MKHLQKVTVRILNTASSCVFRDCTRDKEYEGQYVAVGERDVFGDMTYAAHEPCYQFKDDTGDWVVIAYADKYLDVTGEAEVTGDAPADNYGAPCTIVWKDETTSDATPGKEYKGYIITADTRDYLDGAPFYPREVTGIYVQFIDDSGDCAVRLQTPGRYTFK